MRVLIVDDSLAFRVFLRKCLDSEPDIKVVARAKDGVNALDMIESHKPDVIVMDLEMPKMDGLTAMKVIRNNHPRIKVVILSIAITPEQKRSLRALGLSDDDLILKPTDEDSPRAYIQRTLINRLNNLPTSTVRADKSSAAATGLIKRPTATASSPSKEICLHPRPAIIRPNILLIGSSTGGPDALGKLLSNLKHLPVPAMIVQHMPPLFVKTLADNLNKRSKFKVHVAEAEVILEPGKIYIAPGGIHSKLKRLSDGRFEVYFDDGAPVHHCRPAVDVMFDSFISYLPTSNAVVVVLTGMGRDGAAKGLALADRGAYTIAQDQESSVVWGMPGALTELAGANEVLPLDDIASRVEQLFRGDIKGRR